MTSIKQVMQTSMQTQSHAVLSFEVKRKRSLIKLRHQIKYDKAFCYPCRHKKKNKKNRKKSGLIAAADPAGKRPAESEPVDDAHPLR